MIAQYLKVTEKVSFDIASEASYVYSSGQTVLPHMSILIEQNMVENVKN